MELFEQGLSKFGGLLVSKIERSNDKGRGGMKGQGGAILCRKCESREKRRRGEKGSSQNSSLARNK